MADKITYKNTGGFAYFLAFLGAAVYYIQQSNGAGEAFVGFLKACVWPAFLVYQLLQHIT